MTVNKNHGRDRNRDKTERGRKAGTEYTNQERESEGQGAAADQNLRVPCSVLLSLALPPRHVRWPNLRVQLGRRSGRQHGFSYVYSVSLHSRVDKCVQHALHQVECACSCSTVSVMFTVSPFIPELTSVSSMHYIKLSVHVVAARFQLCLQCLLSFQS